MRRPPWPDAAWWQFGLVWDGVLGVTGMGPGIVRAIIASIGYEGGARPDVEQVAYPVDDLLPSTNIAKIPSHRAGLVRFRDLLEVGPDW